MARVVALASVWCGAHGLLAGRRAARRPVHWTPLRSVGSETEVEVFIESTDAFQVVFYANYVKFLEYGLGERVFAVDGMKYRQPAVLGDTLVVATTDDGQQTLSRKSDGASLITTTRTSGSPVATVPAPPPSAPDGSVRLRARHAARHDDLDGRDGSLSLDACLRAFERSRSTFLGGASELAALLDGGTTVVVATVDGLRYAPRPVRLGDVVDVSADVSLQRTRIVFDQSVSVDGAPAAYAKITCVCVDTARGRPCAPPPQVLALFEDAAR